MKPTWVVCVKQVPREPVFKKVGDSFQIDRDHTEGVLNPCDRFALDCAGGLKEKAGGSIVALSMGPPKTDEALREALACGADRAILLSDPAFAGADTLATAYTLAAAIRKLGAFSLILCGARTLDSDTGQVGPQLAELLDLPMAAYVRSLSLRQGTLRIDRRMDDTRERLMLKLPALITVEDEKKKAWGTSLASLQQSFSRSTVLRWKKEDLNLEPDCIGWDGSATRARDYAFWKRERSGEIVRAKAGEAAERILSVLLERNILGH